MDGPTTETGRRCVLKYEHIIEPHEMQNEDSEHSHLRYRAKKLPQVGRGVPWQAPTDKDQDQDFKFSALASKRPVEQVIPGKILKSHQQTFLSHEAPAQTIEMPPWKANIQNNVDGITVVTSTTKKHVRKSKCGIHSFIHSFRSFLKRLFKSTTIQKRSPHSTATMQEFLAEAPQETAS